MRPSTVIALSLCISCTQVANSQTSADKPSVGPTTEDAASRPSESSGSHDTGWLEQFGEYGQIISFPNGVAYFRGYYQASELTTERLAQLSKAPLVPDVILVDPETAKIGETEVFWLPDTGPQSPNCGALIQLISGKNSAKSGGTASSVVKAFKGRIPERPLTATCEYAPIPPVPPEFLERNIDRSVGPILRERDRPCSEFQEMVSGAIKLSDGVRIDLRKIAVGPTLPSQPQHDTLLHFDSVMRSMIASLTQRGLDSFQVMSYGNYAKRPNDVDIEMRVIEDVSADKFCYSVQISQGTSITRFLFQADRTGQVLPWHYFAAGQRRYSPKSELHAFGTRIGQSLEIERN